MSTVGSGKTWEGRNYGGCQEGGSTHVGMGPWEDEEDILGSEVFLEKVVRM